MSLRIQLKKIDEKQVENKRALKKYEEVHLGYETVKHRESRLFDWLYSTWKKDEELTKSIMNKQLDLQAEESIIQRKFVDYKVFLQTEKNNLSSEEEELRSLMEDVDRREEES